MKPQYLLIALGAYMLVMALLGYIRTGSPTAIYIMGGLGVMTAVLGMLHNPSNSPLVWLTIGWIGIITVMLVIMTLKRIAAHDTARAGSEYVFGSTALFALITLFVLIRAKMQSGGN